MLCRSHPLEEVERLQREYFISLLDDLFSFKDYLLSLQPLICFLESNGLLISDDGNPYDSSVVLREENMRMTEEAIASAEYLQSVGKRFYDECIAIIRNSEDYMDDEQLQSRITEAAQYFFSAMWKMQPFMTYRTADSVPRNELARLLTDVRDQHRMKCQMFDPDVKT